MNKKPNWKLTSYRSLNKNILQPLLWPRFLSKTHLQEVKSVSNPFFNDLSAGEQKECIWFHAASTGELESLWPVIIEASIKKYKPLVLTVFSESARNTLRKLEQEVKQNGASVLFSGFSPWEGSWGAAFKKLKPIIFVTAKYEAWPELWMSLREQNSPLIIVGAKQRRSLNIAKKMCGLFGFKCPDMHLLVAEKNDIDILKGTFPDANIKFIPDPRWERVYQRSQTKNPRVKELLEK